MGALSTEEQTTLADLLKTMLIEIEQPADSRPDSIPLTAFRNARRIDVIVTPSTQAVPPTTVTHRR